MRQPSVVSAEVVLVSMALRPMWIRWLLFVPRHRMISDVLDRFRVGAGAERKAWANRRRPSDVCHRGTCSIVFAQNGRGWTPRIAHVRIRTEEGVVIPSPIGRNGRGASARTPRSENPYSQRLAPCSSERPRCAGYSGRVRKQHHRIPGGELRDEVSAVRGGVVAENVL